MADASLARKLQMKPGQRALVLNAPPRYLEELGAPEGVELLEAPDGSFDFVHLFVRNVERLERFSPAALAAINPGGVIWVSYP